MGSRTKEQVKAPVIMSALTMKPRVDSPNSISTRELNLKDRCDRCSAAAYVRAVKNSQELLFCSHHGRQNLEGLHADGWKIDDQTHKNYASYSASLTTDE